MSDAGRDKWDARRHDEGAGSHDAHATKYRPFASALRGAAGDPLTPGAGDGRAATAIELAAVSWSAVDAAGAVRTGDLAVAAAFDHARRRARAAHRAGGTDGAAAAKRLVTGQLAARPAPNVAQIPIAAVDEPIVARVRSFR